MQQRFLVYIFVLIFLVVFAGGCAKRGHIITVGPTGLDPDAKPPTIRTSTDEASDEAGDGQDDGGEDIVERIPPASPGEFDCDAEAAQLEADLAAAREQNSKIEEEFLDVLTELSAAQSQVDRGNTSEALDRQGRAQAAYKQMNERAEESRETVKNLKLALKLARERCEGLVSEAIAPEKVAPASAPSEQSCDKIDVVMEDIENARQDFFDLEQDHLEELEERYALDDELDEAQASGNDTEDSQAEIDEIDETLNTISDEISDRKDALADLRRSLAAKKDSCTLPRDATRLCGLSRTTIEGTINNLDDGIQGLEDNIDDLRADRRSAIEEGNADARIAAEEDLASARNDLRDKQEDLFEEKDDLAAHEALC